MNAMPKPDPNEPATKADLANLVTKDELKSELKFLKSDLQADFAVRLYGALMTQMAITLAAVYFIVHNLR
jgi:hypothetical protein